MAERLSLPALAEPPKGKRLKDKVVMLTGVGEEVAQRARALLASAHDLVDVAASQQQPMHGGLHRGLGSSRECSGIETR